MMEMVCETDSLDRDLQDSITELNIISEQMQIESKKAKRELFKGFIRTLEKQDGITCEFDAGIWSSLVQVLFVTLPAPNPSQILQIKRRYSINYSDV